MQRIPVEIRTCRTCGRKILLRDTERARNFTRKPLNLDNTPHECQWEPEREKEILCLTATQFIAEINNRLGGSTILSLVRHDREEFR